METSSALLALCAGNSPVPGEFPAQRPVTQRFDVFFDLRLNKRLSKNNGEAGDLRRNRAHYDVIVMSWLKLHCSKTFQVTQIYYRICMNKYTCVSLVPLLFLRRHFTITHQIDNTRNIFKVCSIQISLTGHKITELCATVLNQLLIGVCVDLLRSNGTGPFY